MEALAVVGDVQGDARKLRVMLEKLQAFEGRVVFVGDYVGGGRDSAEVIEILATLAPERPGCFVFLCGNHDLSLLRYVDDGDFDRFGTASGLDTLASYLPVVTGDVHTALREVIPPKHVAFLRSLAPFWETEDCLVSHAGFDPARPRARDVKAMTNTEGRSFSDLARGPGKLVVCGHYVQPEGPFDSPHLICVDTGCGILPDGRLTAVFLPERRFVSVG
jgi:serine/threonine protein phosphatase 1